MGFISLASLVSRYVPRDFCVRKDSEAQRGGLVIGLHGLPWFRREESK